MCYRSDATTMLRRVAQRRVMLKRALRRHGVFIHGDTPTDTLLLIARLLVAQRRA